MLYRIAIAAALGLAALTAPADAQSTAQVLPSCGSASLPLGPGGRLYVDQTGNLCTAGGSGGGGSVTQGTDPWRVSGNSTPNSSSNPIFTNVTNVVPVSQFGTWAASGMNAAGTTATAAPVLVGGVDGSTVRTIATTPSGAVYISGTVGVTGVAATAEQGSALAAVGITPAITQSGTAVVGKASQGNLYSAYAVNTTATAGYLACINATAAPAAGAAITPIDVQTLAGAVGATASINYGAGPPNAYSTGITCLVTTSLTTYTAGGASFIQARVR